VALVPRDVPCTQDCQSIVHNILVPRTLTHYGNLVSRASIIGKAGVIADRAPTDDRIRTLHFVG
jgi:hypothetical protein